MLKKTITYKDFNDIERTEDFYFNLTKSELTEMQLSMPGGLTETIQKAFQTQDVPAVIKMFKEIIFRSYGEKSLDGKRFIKSKQLSEEFSQTPAYDQLFIELLEDEGAFTAFISGIIPKEIADKINEQGLVENK